MAFRFRSGKQSGQRHTDHIFRSSWLCLCQQLRGKKKRHGLGVWLQYEGDWLRQRGTGRAHRDSKCEICSTCLFTRMNSKFHRQFQPSSQQDLRKHSTETLQTKKPKARIHYNKGENKTKQKHHLSKHQDTVQPKIAPAPKSTPPAAFVV